MKIKKEYIVIAALIVAASLYLLRRNADRTHYELPVLERIDAARVTRLEIERPAGELALARRGSGWVVEPRGYPVDGARIDEMLSAVGSLTATSLVSVSGNYPQYDLGSETKISVAAYGGAESLRRFEVGKTASTHRHTYVVLDGDPRIYKARENIRRIFEIELDRLRDRSCILHQGTEHTVYEARRTVRAKSLGQLDSLVDGYLDGRLTVDGKLKDGYPKDVAINVGHLLKRPLRGMAMDERVKHCLVLEHAAHQILGKSPGCIRQARHNKPLFQHNSRRMIGAVNFVQCL